MVRPRERSVAREAKHIQISETDSIASNRGKFQVINFVDDFERSAAISSERLARFGNLLRKNMFIRHRHSQEARRRMSIRQKLEARNETRLSQLVFETFAIYQKNGG